MYHVHGSRFAWVALRPGPIDVRHTRDSDEFLEEGVPDYLVFALVDLGNLPYGDLTIISPTIISEKQLDQSLFVDLATGVKFKVLFETHFFC